MKNVSEIYVERDTNMTRYEKSTFIRFTLIYMSIAFLLFLSVGAYFYIDKKHTIENNLAVEMSSYAANFRNNTLKAAPFGYTITLEDNTKYPYPAFLHENQTYINTSCAGSIEKGKIIVVKSHPAIIQKHTKALKKEFMVFLLVSFVINLIISLLLAWISLRPVRLAHEEFKQFVDDVIHDLNAPVSALNINVESLKESYNTDERLSRVSRSVDSIQNLYMNLKALLSERYTEAKPMDISKVCQSVTKQLKTIYPNVQFILKVPPIQIYANESTFERIITNLIENAVKYSTKKPIIELGVDDKNHFYVKDNGLGMNNLEVLLKRTKQSSATNTGYGLGLSIVQRLSNECKINFDVKSIKNEGTTFYFDISKQIVNTK